MIERKWPDGCQDLDSCSGHEECMYLNCYHSHRGIKAEIQQAIVEKEINKAFEKFDRLIDEHQFDQQIDSVYNLKRNLRSRDDFIVSKGLWQEFVDQLPKSPRKDQQ